jgi:hypothetical protein
MAQIITKNEFSLSSSYRWGLYYKHLVKLTLENWLKNQLAREGCSKAYKNQLAREKCPRVYIHTVKIILNQCETLRS